MKNFILLSIIFLGILSKVKGQDIHFSQFDETTIQLNPANAGVRYETRASANYKSQWQSVNAPFKTVAVSVDNRFFKTKKAHLGAGIDFFSDNAGNGQNKTIQANLTLSGIVRLNKNNLLSAGLVGGFVQRSLNSGSLSWGNQYNGLTYDSNMPTGEPLTSTNFAFFDMGAGIQYSYGEREMYISANNARRLNIGVAIFHPHRPNYSYYSDGTRLYPKFVFHGDASLGIKNTSIVLKPSYMIFLQGPTREITPGMMFQYVLQDDSRYTGIKKATYISLGGYYRIGDAFIAAAKFEWNNYAIGLSYDINISKLRTASKARGGFEICLRAGFNTYKKAFSKAIF